MSYDIHLEDEKGERVLLDEPLGIRGGTYCIGGTREAWLNVTYNYSKFFYEHIDPDLGIRFLYGKKAADCIPILEKAIAALGTDRDSDYWKATAGNAGAALADLLTLAKASPNSIFNGD